MKNADPHTSEIRALEARDPYFSLLTGAVILFGLYITSLDSYLLFHSLAELFSVVIAFGIFVVAWNSRPFLNNNYLLFIGIAYLFIGWIDLVHALAYKGMGVFKAGNANIPTQLWIAARALQSLSLLVAPFFVGRRFGPRAAFAAYAAIFLLLLWSIFGGDAFPRCYVEGTGLTPFKKNSEYAISFALLLSGAALFRKRNMFDRRVLTLILLSIAATVVSELAFTFYVGVYDLSNLVGHLFKIISFYLIYVAIIRTGIRDPLDIIFKTLKKNEEDLRKSKEELEMRVAGRTRDLNASKELLEREIEEHKRTEQALNEQYSTLRGILESTSELIFSVDRQYRYTSFNSAHATVMRAIYGAEIGTGRGILEFMTVAEDRDKAKENIDRALNGERHVQSAYSGDDARSRLYFEVSHSPISSGDGSVIGVAVLSRDITGRKRAEEAQRRYVDEIEDLYNSAPCGYHSLDPSGLFIRINNTELQWLGYSRDEIIGKKKFSDFVTGESLQAFRDNYPLFKERGWVKDLEFEMIRRNGSLLPVLLSAGAIYDDDGSYVMSRSTLYDMTERRKAEEALRRSEERYRKLFSEMTTGCALQELVFGEKGRAVDYITLEVNSAFESILGVKRENIIGVPVSNFLSREELKQWLDIFGSVVDKGRSSRYEMYSLRDGKFFEGVAYSPEPGKCAVTFSDVTERKRAEAALKKSEEQYRMLIHRIQTAVVVHAPDTRIIASNPLARKLLGLTEDQMTGKTSIDPAWHLLKEDGTVMPLDEYPAGLAIKTKQALEKYIVGIRRTGGGEVIWTLVNAVPVLDEQNNINQVIVSFVDISDRKNMEKALSDSEQKYRDIFDNVLDGLYLLEVTEDGRFRTLEINPALERSTGIPRAQVIGKTQEEAVAPEVAGAVNAKYRHCVESGRPIDEESMLDLPAGRRHYHSTLIPLRDGAGRVSRIIGISRDVTALRKAEEERIANLRFFEIMDRVNRAMQGANDLEQMTREVLDVVLDLLDCDRAFLMYPCDPEAGSWTVPMERNKPEYPGLHALGSEVPMEAEVAETLRILLASEGPVKFGPGTAYALPADVSERFGLKCLLSMAIHPLLGKPWQFGVHQCSYARAWTPEEEKLLKEIGRRLADGLTGLLMYCDLRESEAKYRQIVDTAVEGIWTLGPDLATEFVNVRMAEMLGYAAEEMIGRPVTDFMFSEDLPDDERRMENRRNGMSETYERRYRRKDGSIVWTLASATPIFDDERCFTGSIAMFTDITGRKRAEEELRKSEAFIKNILESVDEGFVVVDREYRILSANKAFGRLAGVPEAAAAGRRCYDVSHHAGKPCFDTGEECPVKHTFETGISHNAVHQHTDSAGVKYVVEIKSYPVLDASGTVVSVIETISDITEKRKLEEQLHQAQKMEAIGTLAGGVAHDFNNILTAIIGYGNIVKMKMRHDDPQRISVDQILASSERAARLTQGLLAFSRKQVINPKPVDVNEIVKSVENLLRRLIGEDVELVTRTAGQSLLVMADTGQIEQVLMNLATNARDAMPEGGLLVIETEEIDVQEDVISAHGCGKPGKYALTTVSDTGGGMDAQTREKIFEPFFTTKELGKGTGLGLAIVYGIIKQHEGNVTVYSEPGKGTTFKIYLPLIATAVEEAKPEAAAPPRGGTETILLAEDDRDLIAMTASVLKEFGYTVIEAVDGQDAVEKYVAHAKEIDLLLLDVIMPKKSGREAYDAVKAAWPDIKALFISGYTADIIHKKGIFEEGIEFISKPVSPFDLVRKIRELLDRKK
jgi:PAS domain S-box-containing protein